MKSMMWRGVRNWPFFPLRAHALEEILEGVTQLLVVRVGEAVHLGEEHGENATVAEFQEGVAEDVAEEAGEMRGFLGMAERLDALGEKRHPLIGGDGLWEQRAPAVRREAFDEEAAFAAHLHGLLIKVVHELVDERQSDELDLVGGQRELAHEHIAAGINATFGFGGEHRRLSG
jgi:hypothetical protein